MPSGALSSVHYGFEKYFDSDAGTSADWNGDFKVAESEIIFTFGHGIKISNLERNNNVENIWGLGSRSPTTNIEKKFVGSFSVDFIMSNPDVFTHILGAGLLIGDADVWHTTFSADVISGNYNIVVAANAGMVVGGILQLTNSAGDIEYVQIAAIDITTITLFSPLVFSYASTDVVTIYTDVSATDEYIHVYKEMNLIPSIQIQNSIDLATPQQWLLKGCINTNMTISAAINEPVSVKMDYSFMDEVRSATAFTPQTAETYDVFSFAHGELSVPGGTALANVQSIEISLSQNSETIYGLGSRVGTSGLGKNREYSVSASMFFLDPANLMNYMYDGSNTGITPGFMADTTLKLVFDNGQSGSDNRTVQVEFGKVKIDTETLNQAVDAAVMEDITFKVTSGQIIAKTDASTIPFIWV